MMAELCDHYRMRPCDVWDLTGEEYRALADRMRVTQQAAERGG